jgi:CBS domain-containing protein
LVEVASQMRELDVGALPICENDRLAGMITDRDLVLRGLAEGRDPHSTPVRALMSPGIIYIFEEQDVEEAARLMEVKKIRRLPVLNSEKRLVGIVSLGDLAVDAGMVLSGEALKEISRPVHHNSS